MEFTRFFEEWPFSVVPDRSAKVKWSTHWELKEQIDGYISSLKFRPQSTLDLVWASFGSGKTHLLYYLEQRAEKLSDLVSWYCTVPQSAKNFADFYRAIMTNFPDQSVRSNVLEHMASHSIDDEIAPVLEALFLGSQDQRQLARDWFKGNRVDLRSAKKLISLPYKLESPAQMTAVLISFIRTICSSGMRVMILLDEFQRSQSNLKFSQAVNAALLDVFNSIPRGLSIIFSCSAVQQAAAKRVFADELQDRMRGRIPFCLPTLDVDEAVDFVRSLISDSRPAGYEGHEFEPFNESELRSILAQFDDKDSLRLIPRHIIQVLDSALTMAMNDSSKSIVEGHLSAALNAVQIDSDG